MRRQRNRIEPKSFYLPTNGLITRPNRLANQYRILELNIYNLGESQSNASNSDTNDKFAWSELTHCSNLLNYGSPIWSFLI